MQQVFTIWSETWVYDYDVSVAFSDPDSVPEGTKIVDANNKEITAVTTKYTSDGYAGTFKVLYPAGSVEGQSGNVQFSLSAPVAQYAAMYAVCQKRTNTAIYRITSVTWTTRYSWMWPPSAAMQTVGNLILTRRP